MTRSYSLNTEAAKQAEGSRITETGKYVGQIIVAEAVISTKGTEGVEFSFKSDSGQSADYMTLWTHTKDGAELYGFKVLNAMMTCAQLRTITPKTATLRKRGDSGPVDVQSTIFDEFTGKPIGLLLQREPYTKNDGGAGSRMVIQTPFCPTTERTASEILDKKPKGETLAKLVASLRDRPMQKNANAGAPPRNSGAGAGMAVPGAGFEDDDIPFAPMHWKAML